MEGNLITAQALSSHELPPDALRRTFPALYATEEVPTSDKVIHVHFFCAMYDWYLVEFDPEDRYCFGYIHNIASPFKSEWSYFDLDELEGLLVPTRTEWSTSSVTCRLVPQLMSEIVD